jgi:hypothetical protein
MMDIELRGPTAVVYVSMATQGNRRLLSKSVDNRSAASPRLLDWK